MAREKASHFDRSAASAPYRLSWRTGCPAGPPERRAGWWVRSLRRGRTPSETRSPGWRRFRSLYFPAVFPHLVTGWVTAAGGAWNASIVAEFVTFKGETLRASGVGAEISAAAAAANFPLLAASIALMSTLVVAFNRTVWRRCYQVAEDRFSLNR